MTGQDEKELEALYGPSAPFSEHKRGDHISYTNGKGEASSGTILWVQARFENISQKYVVMPDAPGGFPDFILPGDVRTQDEAGDLVRCPWCGNMHPANQVDECPLKPSI